jgi:hypothetical protein
MVQKCSYLIHWVLPFVTARSEIPRCASEQTPQSWEEMRLLRPDLSGLAMRKNGGRLNQATTKNRDV